MSRWPCRSAAWGVVLFALAGPAAAQGTRADYARAGAESGGTFGAVRRARVVPHWTADGNAFWYATVDENWLWRFWWVDAVAGTRRLAVDPTRLATALFNAKLAPYTPEDLRIVDLDPLPDGRLRVAVSGQWVTVDLKTYALSDVVSFVDADSPAPHRLAVLGGRAVNGFDKEAEDAARVVVVNRSDGSVRVERVADDGTREPACDPVPARDSAAFNVWSGQVLAVADADGNPVFDADGNPTEHWRADGDGGMLVVAPQPSRGGFWTSFARAMAGSTRPSVRPSTLPATRPVTRGTTRPATRLATRPTRRPATGETTRPTTRPTTDPTTRSTTGPATGPATAGPVEPGGSPDGHWVAFVRDHDLWLRDRRRAGRAAVRLTRDGTAADGYESNDALYWSPDSAALVALRWADGADRQATLVQSSPPGRLQPAVETIPYPVPGDRIGHYWPHLFDVGRRREVPITGLDATDPETVTGPLWDNDPTRFTFTYDRRGHQLARMFAVETATGRGRTLIEERSDTFIDRDLRWDWYDSNTHQQLWMSERDGYNHLYRFDSRDGRLLNQITRGPWVVQKWDGRVDQVYLKASNVFFRAAGVDPAQDPYYVHSCRVHLDGTGFQDLTPADGTHAVQDSPNGDYYLDTYSRVDLPPVTELRRYSDGGLVCPVERADWTPLLLTGWRPPERFAAKGRDGKTDIYGVIYRPRHFDPAAKYPVVEDIYAGPQEASVPKAFTRYCYPMSIAELGFVVVQIDGMGTPGRGKAFHDACWHNWADCGFPDRIAWLRAAAAKHPEMDLTRVGIEGGSFGGYAAVRALEDHGDVYKAAVALDGCHDPRLYSQWYGEQYLGWPVGPWYADQSNARHVDRIAGHLLLVVDEMDHNVQPAATMRVVDALVKADKDFEFLEVPNGDHASGAYDYVDRRRKDFLVRHLLGVEPRAK